VIGEAFVVQAVFVVQVEVIEKEFVVLLEIVVVLKQCFYQNEQQLESHSETQPVPHFERQGRKVVSGIATLRGWMRGIASALLNASAERWEKRLVSM
jgi:hypothetical protein